MSAPQKCVIPKEKAMLCLFFFRITHFWGADIIRGDTVFEVLLIFYCRRVVKMNEKAQQEIISKALNFF